jgi:hypothetical protein
VEASESELADVAQNVDGSQIEQKLGRSIMPRLHAGYSFGTLVGAGLGSLCSAIGVSVHWQMSAVLPLVAILILVTYRFIPAKSGVVKSAGAAKTTTGTDSAVTEEARSVSNQSAAEVSAKRIGALRLLFGSNLILLGLGIFSITVVEGASNDWLALSLVENYAASPARAGIGLRVFGWRDDTDPILRRQPR